MFLRQYNEGAYSIRSWDCSVVQLFVNLVRRYTGCLCAKKYIVTNGRITFNLPLKRESPCTTKLTESWKDENNFKVSVGRN